MVLLVTGAAVAACSQAAGGQEETGSGRTLVVLAAASLTETFTMIAEDFEAAHPDVEVELGLAGSAEVVQQVLAGAPADVVATASTSTMDLLTDAVLVTAPRTFATNTLEIAVPVGDPAGVEGLPDLARPGVTVAVCAPEVPCGEATRDLLTTAGIDIVPVTLETDVRAVLTKVRLGEVDAGLVYRTDVRAAAGDVTGVPLAPVVDASGGAGRTTYPVAALADAPAGDLAEVFVEHVLGPRGQAVLADAGFGPP
ncbi:molybdate ABC transporter substrate-binding protein [Sanguibacter suaedae]|uniref:Molybdate ABC transporter substrate-binding protein n=1 Tax=Sanguibacter suaedae TaxID=2795737 RepID=A0A934IB77_9MICO|nr:molybdate ABC transporter substrate-binding protein [Sanguibacter suaedae]MBI9115237.1 molybdate ABC transporter substrate-binding protein [Sanguibacter suaedae]